MPVLKISPTGAITTVDTLANAAPNFDNSGVRIIVTTDQVVDTDIAFPIGTSLEITNSAVIEIDAGKRLDLGLCEFRSPTHDWHTGTGTVSIPNTGSMEQTFLADNVTCYGVLATGLMVSPIFNGNATSATNSDGTGTIPKCSQVATRIIYGRVALDGTGSGTGWTSARNGTGDYTITFSTPFTAIPALVAITEGAALVAKYIDVSSSGSAARINLVVPTTSALFDAQFSFIAIGA